MPSLRAERTIRSLEGGREGGKGIGLSMYDWLLLTPQTEP